MNEAEISHATRAGIKNLVATTSRRIQEWNYACYSYEKMLNNMYVNRMNIYLERNLIFAVINMM